MSREAALKEFIKDDIKMKVRSCNGVWIVKDRGVEKLFYSSREVWEFVMLIKEIRGVSGRVLCSPNVVRSLVPTMAKKRVSFNVHKEKALA